MAPGVDGIIKAGGSGFKDGDDETGDLPGGSNTVAFRRGGRCCMCCCDYRRAVLIVDVILWISTFVGFIYEVALEEHMIPITAPQVTEDMDDNAASQIQDAIADSALMKFSIAVNALHSFLFLPMSFCGALKFKWTWVIGFCAWYIVAGILGIALAPKFCEEIHEDFDDDAALQDCKPHPVGWVFQGVVLILVLYPHMVFMRQCRRDILNPETYHSQEKSCCCSA